MTVREGFLDMNEAARLFAATDTVVLAYRIASQSGVLLLAYCFKRPVIIYPIDGLAEAVVEGETGWICARPDVECAQRRLERQLQQAGRSVVAAAKLETRWPGSATDGR